MVNVTCKFPFWGIYKTLVSGMGFGFAHSLYKGNSEQICVKITE